MFFAISPLYEQRLVFDIGSKVFVCLLRSRWPQILENKPRTKKAIYTCKETRKENKEIYNGINLQCETVS